MVTTCRTLGGLVQVCCWEEEERQAFPQGCGLLGGGSYSWDARVGVPQEATAMSRNRACTHITGKVLLQRAGSFQLSFISLVTASHTQAGLHCTCSSLQLCHQILITLLQFQAAVCARIHMLHCISTSAHQLAYSLGSRQASTNSSGSPETKGGNKGAFVGGALTSQGTFPGNHVIKLPTDSFLAQKSRDSRH